MEKWKAIPGYENRYEVSSYGNVRSFVAPNVKNVLLKIPVIKKQRITSKGYKRVVLYSCEQKRKIWEVHKLVAMTFIGERKIGMLVCHLNDIKKDNRVENIVYGTAKENMNHAFINRTLCLGTRVNTCKLDENKVREIRLRFSNGEKQVNLSKIYGVRQATISSIVLKKIWRHI